MASLEALKALAKDELVQLAEEGAAVEDLGRALQMAYEKSEDLQLEALDVFWREAAILRDSAARGAEEPSDLQGIQAARPDGPRRLPMADGDKLTDRIHGAWLGRCAGCMLGKPVEGWTREKIERLLRAADAYPLDNYFPVVENLPEGLQWHPSGNDCLLGNITHSVRDDDTDYTILGLHVLEAHGQQFTPQDVANEWLLRLPYHRTYTAERVAYRNFVNDVWPPESAVLMNPYREWIGAQIRADAFGYCAPGWPEKAAEFAFRDAMISHTKNGIYGEMFFAALIAACLAMQDLREAIEVALTEIPVNCRLAEAVRDMMTWCDGSWEQTWDRVMEKYGHYHPVHTINNACLVLMGLLHANGDFTKAISIAVMGGLDTDCNGATAGSVLGALLGAEALPAKWTEPLDDTLHSALEGMNVNSISGLAQRTAEVAEKVLSGSR
ncbi:MAG: ADP-ribosylglycohydrolase family protein [Armatimonadia bacterium]